MEIFVEIFLKIREFGTRSTLNQIQLKRADALVKLSDMAGKIIHNTNTSYVDLVESIVTEVKVLHNQMINETYLLASDIKKWLKEERSKI